MLARCRLAESPSMTGPRSAILTGLAAADASAANSIPLAVPKTTHEYGLSTARHLKHRQIPTNRPCFPVKLPADDKSKKIEDSRLTGLSAPAYIPAIGAATR